MPKSRTAGPQQPIRSLFAERLLPIIPVVFVLLSSYNGVKHVLLHLFLSFLTYWIARILYINWKWFSFYRNVPHMPNYKFFLGHVGVIKPDELILRLKDVFDQIGGYQAVWMPWPYSPLFSVAEPDGLRQIMSGYNTPKGMIMRFFEYGTNFFDSLGSGWLGQGLLTSNGELWKSRRDLLTPSFHFQILQGYMQVFQSRANILSARLRSFSDGKSHDVFPLCTDCTLDIIGACAFGIDLGCQTSVEPSNYVKAIRRISSLIFDRTFHPVYGNTLLYMLSPTGREFSRLVREVHALPNRLIRERRAYLKEHGEAVLAKKRLDFLDVLLTIKDEDGEGLSELAIRNEVDTFLFEGHDTTAAGLGWTLYCLASNPEYQKRAQEEVDKVLHDHDEPTYEEARNQFELLELILKESLRLYPPVPFIVRNSDVDLQVGPYTVPAETEIICQIFTAHRHPGFWTDPERFWPERFRVDGIKHPYAYIPFSAGQRSCIGQVFATLEEKTILAMLLKRFEFVLDDTVPIELETHVILRPRHGINLYIRERNK